MPGENAPPMHPHCRRSTSAYEDSKEYEAWLDYLSKGGTTEEWNRLKEIKKANKSSATNNAANVAPPPNTIGSVDCTVDSVDYGFGGGYGGVKNG